MGSFGHDGSSRYSRFCQVSLESQQIKMQPSLRDHVESELESYKLFLSEHLRDLRIQSEIEESELKKNEDNW
jgi:ribosome-associated translation inhibitor RaiA